MANWQNVTAPSFQESNALRLAAEQQLLGGLKGLADTSQTYTESIGKRNTNDLSNLLSQAKTPEEATALIQQARDKASGMYGNYDQDAFRKAVAALPKDVADAQERDFFEQDQTAIKAASLAFSKGDFNKVGEYASQVRSKGGLAQINALTGQAFDLYNKNESNVITREKITSDEKQNAADNAAKIQAARIAANASGSKGDKANSVESFILRSRALMQKQQKAAEDSTKSTDSGRANLQSVKDLISADEGTLGSLTGEYVHGVLKKNIPEFAAMNDDNQAKYMKVIREKYKDYNIDPSDDDMIDLVRTMIGDSAAQTQNSNLTDQRDLVDEFVVRQALDGKKVTLEEAAIGLGFDPNKLYPKAESPPADPLSAAAENERIRQARETSSQKGTERERSQKEAEAKLKNQVDGEMVGPQGGQYKRQAEPVHATRQVVDSNPRSKSRGTTQTINYEQIVLAPYESPPKGEGWKKLNPFSHSMSEAGNTWVRGYDGK